MSHPTLTSVITDKGSYGKRYALGVVFGQREWMNNADFGVDATPANVARGLRELADSIDARFPALADREEDGSD